VILEPVSLDRTRLISYGLTNRGRGADAEEAAKRDASFVNNTGAQEDREVVSSIQRSIDSGANEFFTFGQFESLIVHFHRSMHAALDAAGYVDPNRRG